MGDLAMSQTSHLFMIRSHLGVFSRPVLPAGFELRTYQSGDEAAWLRMIRLATGEVWPEGAFDKCVRSDVAFREERLFFVTCNGEQVGTACAFQKLCHGDRTGYVHMIAVLPRFQRRGLGSALLCHCLRYFARQGWRDAVLDTDTSRLPAIRLYLAHGFMPFPENSMERKSWQQVLPLLGRQDLVAELEVHPEPQRKRRPPAKRARHPRRPPPRQTN